MPSKNLLAERQANNDAKNLRGAQGCKPARFCSAKNIGRAIVGHAEGYPEKIGFSAKNPKSQHGWRKKTDTQNIFLFHNYICGGGVPKNRAASNGLQFRDKLGAKIPESRYEIGCISQQIIHCNISPCINPKPSCHMEKAFLFFNDLFRLFPALASLAWIG